MYNHINEGIERIRRMNEDSVHENRAPRLTIEDLEKAGVDMNDVKQAVGGSFDNVLHVERVDDTSWRLKVRRIAASGNYTETIKVTAVSSTLNEAAEPNADASHVQYRLDANEALHLAAEVLGQNFIKAETIHNDPNNLMLSVRENNDTNAMHRMFASFNETIHRSGWHAVMAGTDRWSLRPLTNFIERRTALRSADKPNHLYPPAYYAGRSTEAALRSSEVRDDVKTESAEDTIEESDARKRAFKAGIPYPQSHFVAQSTDAIMYPSVGNNNNDKKDGKKGSSSKKDPAPLSKAVDGKGMFL